MIRDEEKRTSIYQHYLERRNAVLANDCFDYDFEEAKQQPKLKSSFDRPSEIDQIISLRKQQA